MKCLAGSGAIIVAMLLLSSCDALRKGTAGDSGLVHFEDVFTLSRVVSLQEVPGDPVGNPSALVKWGDRIAVVDVMQRNVKIFNDSGRHISTIGRAGDGPGEFRRPFSAIVLGDGRLAVADKMHTRVSIFDQDGAYEGSWNYRIGPAGTAVGIEGGAAILVSARRTQGAMGGADLYVHEVDGGLRNAIEVVDSLPDPRAMSAGMPMVAVLEGSAFVVEPTLTRIRVVSLLDGSQMTTELSLPNIIWKDWDWSEAPEQLDLGIQWVTEQTWLRQPLGDGLHEFIVPVSRFNAGPDRETLTSYVRVMRDGTVAAATFPSPRWITSVVGDTAYGAEITEGGESVLYVYAVTWPSIRTAGYGN